MYVLIEFEYGCAHSYYNNLDNAINTIKKQGYFEVENKDKYILKKFISELREHYAYICEIKTED